MPATLTFEVEGVIGEITIPVHHEEILYGEYIDYVKCRERYYQANQEEADQIIEGSGDLDMDDAESVDHMAQAISKICKGDIGLIPGTLPGDDSEELPPLTEGISLARLFNFIENLIYGYVPEFDITKEDYVQEYKGQEYVLKSRSIQNIEHGKGFTTVEVVEVNMIYQLLKKAGDDPDGARMFEADLKMIALLFRLRNEIIPIQKTVRDQWIEDRARLFSELPMNIVLDISFFLRRTWRILKESRRITASLMESQNSHSPKRPMKLKERLRRRGAARHTRNS